MPSCRSEYVTGAFRGDIDPVTHMKWATGANVCLNMIRSLVVTELNWNTHGDEVSHVLGNIADYQFKISYICKIFISETDLNDYEKTYSSCSSCGDDGGYRVPQE